jgi:membrane-bound PQQ-dependent dehydrogenase (glucose/quinate/shikimate family)
VTTDTYPRPRVLAVLMLLLGAALSVPGAALAAAGGSLYYLIAGPTLLVCGVLLFRGDRRGALLYGLLLLATLGWSLFEVGLDPWALLPRLGLLAALGLWLLLPRVRRGLWQGAPPRLRSGWPTRFAAAGVAVFAVLLAAANLSHDVRPPSMPGSGTVHNPSGEWGHYGATAAGTRFAPHDQITPGNVGSLTRAWTYRTGVPGTFKGTPIQLGDALYLCTGRNVVVSLNADSGAERWRFDPQIDVPPRGFWDTCRGVTHYRVPAEHALATCPERIYTATADARLIALDARSGERCEDFGDDGEISLLPGMGEVKPGFYFVTSPPTIASGVLVLGGWVADNQEVEEPSGVVRGFDPLTGALRWAWDMGREDRPGLPEPGKTYTRGTPNVWSLGSADDELGLVYVPTGNATPDYYGGHRTEVMDRYASAVVALDALTGRVRWHFQTTHHDIWDYDVPSQPTLVDVPMNGEIRKALLLPTKRGEVFLLDRVTGEPLAEVAEVPVPQTDVPHEWTSPTQPFSVGMPSFARPRLQESDMWGVTPLDLLLCRLQFRRLRYEGPMTPPSLQGSLYYPGIAGGMNWGSVAVDERNQLMVVNALHMPFVVRLIPRADVTDDTVFAFGGRQSGTPYAAFSVPFLGPLFAPCLRPPYGEMAVVDLASREVLWRRPLGTAADHGPLGIPSRLPLPMGMFYQAGSLVTGGGLIFMGGVNDRTFRAIDLLSGEEVWRDRLPASAQATPMSFRSPVSGRQYLALTVPEAGPARLERENARRDGGEAGEGAGGWVIAYRLPD